MKSRTKNLAPALVLIAVLTASAACGSSGGGDMQSMGGDKAGGESAMQNEETTSGGATGMERTGGMGGMGGMNHGSMGSSMQGASSMLMRDGEYSDERFIDAMVPHHRGAVRMARVALENGEHLEIRNLAENIVSTQRAEIRELKAIKQREYGTSETPMRMSGQDMSMMGMSDPRKLAGQRPFDKAFIEAMTPHHESAIEMAGVARRESDSREIRTLASGIIEAQEREISEMRRWHEKWYPQG